MKIRLLDLNLVTAALFWFACGIPATHAAIIVDNFNTGGGFDTGNGFANAASAFDFAGGLYDFTRSGVKFTVTGGDYTLDSLGLAIQRTGGGTDLLRIYLTTDNGGPGSTLETLSNNQGIWPTSSPGSVTNLTSTSHPLLKNGFSYWIVAELSADPHQIPTSYVWRFNSDSKNSSYRSITTTFSNNYSPDGFQGWFAANDTQQPLAFSVSGTLVAPVPEPGTVALASLGAVGLLVGYVRRRRQVVDQQA